MIAHHTYHYDLWLSRFYNRMPLVAVLQCAQKLHSPCAVETKQDLQVADVGSGWAGDDPAILVGNIGIFVAGIGVFFNTYGKKLLGEFTELQVLVYSQVSGTRGCAVVSLPLSPFALNEELTLAQAVGGGLVFLATFLTSEWKVDVLSWTSFPIRIYFLPQPEEQ